MPDILLSRWLIPAVAVFLIALTPVACQPGPAPTESSDNSQAVLDYSSFVEKLRLLNAGPGNIQDVSQPFLSVAGRSIELYQEQVQVFEYESVDAANKEAQLVDPLGGSVGTTMITWISTPHFYSQGRVIVIYIGDDERVIKVLGEALGAQFAGG